MQHLGAPRLSESLVLQLGAHDAACGDNRGDELGWNHIDGGGARGEGGLLPCVTLMSRYGEGMAVRTGAERYFDNRREDPDYERAYTSARQRIDQIDAIIRTLDERRSDLELSKAELARRAGLRPEVIRRLFSAASPNPTLSTLVALAGALELELTAEPFEDVRVS